MSMATIVMIMCSRQKGEEEEEEEEDVPSCHRHLRYHRRRHDRGKLWHPSHAMNWAEGCRARRARGRAARAASRGYPSSSGGSGDGAAPKGSGFAGAFSGASGLVEQPPHTRFHRSVGRHSSPSQGSLAFSVRLAALLHRHVPRPIDGSLASSTCTESPFLDAHLSGPPGGGAA